MPCSIPVQTAWISITVCIAPPANMGGARLMRAHGNESVEHAMQEIAIISTIMIRLAKSAIILGETIDGPELMWLATQLDRAVEVTRAQH
jgi:hypothetical protein